MTLADFEQAIFATALRSLVCDIPAVVRLTATAIQLRVQTTTGTKAYALIDKGQRIFGADNTGGWHYHPFHDPTRHDRLTDAMTFAMFVAQIEQYYGLT